MGKQCIILFTDKLLVHAQVMSDDIDRISDKQLILFD
jgi:hypothetical protein